MEYAWVIYWRKGSKVKPPVMVCEDEHVAIEAAEEHYNLESIDWEQVNPWLWKEKNGAVVERFLVDDHRLVE